MHMLMMNRWLTASLATIGVLNVVLLDALSQAQPVVNPRSPQLIAQAKCTAADLSRSSPPFQCVTPKAFSCLKRNNAGGGGSLDYRGDTSGDIVVKSNVVGTVALLGFNFNASNETLNLTVKKKNFGVQEQQIWDGFRNTLSKCR